MLKSNQIVLVVVLITVVVALCILYSPIGMRSSDFIKGAMSISRLHYAKSSSVNTDRSLLDPLVKAFFRQQQESRQLTIRKPAFHSLYNAVAPEVLCPRLVRVGNTDDGGKWFCDPWVLPVNCTVYSLGVGGDVTFELELGNITNLRCNIFSVDPDQKYASLVASVPKTTFNAWRVGKIDNPASGIRSVRGMMQHFGHGYLDILKVDIESAEYEVMPDVLSADKPIACQVLIEVHGAANKHADMLQLFAKARYLLFSYEINGYALEACEYSFIHLSCMQSYGISDVLHKLFNVDSRK